MRRNLRAGVEGGRGCRTVRGSEPHGRSQDGAGPGGAEASRSAAPLRRGEHARPGLEVRNPRRDVHATLTLLPHTPPALENHLPC